MSNTPTQTIRRAQRVIKTLRIELRKIDAQPLGPGSDEAWEKLQQIIEWKEEISYARETKSFSLLEGLLQQRADWLAEHRAENN